MANTRTIRNTLNWCAAFLEQQPVLINGMEPALSCSNLVLQTILGPPFSWPFNRKAYVFTATGQDYAASGLNDFGFLEGGSCAPPSGTPFELMVRSILHPEQNTARPMFVSELIDDGAGNITFRLNPAPAAGSFVTLLYQKKATTLLSMGMTWYPLPDEKSYVAQWGLLSLLSLITSDARFGAYNQKFITSLLAQHGGLSALERNMFLANWTAVLKDVQATQLATAERFKAREV
jgi:hypothetical protein